MANPHIDRNIEAHIGARVKAARMLAGMSQDELASRLGGGLTFQQLQEYEKGVNRVSVSRLVEIAKATDQPISFFLPESNEATAVIGFEPSDLALARSLSHLKPQTKRALATFVTALDAA